MIETANRRLNQGCDVAESERAALEAGVNALAEIVFEKSDPAPWSEEGINKLFSEAIQDSEEIQLLMNRVRKGGVTLNPDATVIIELEHLMPRERIEAQEVVLAKKLGCKVVVLNLGETLAGVFGKDDPGRPNPPEDQAHENGPVIADAYNPETKEELICKRNADGEYDIFRRTLEDEGCRVKNEKQVNIKSFPDAAEAKRYMYTKAAEYFGGK